MLIQAPEKTRFIKGAHSTYAMATPTQLRTNRLSMEALPHLQLTTADYEKLWEECILPSPETATKIDKLAIDHIKKYLNDYISIIHRLGKGTDPVAQEILKPGLNLRQIGIDHISNRFSLRMEHMVSFASDNEISQHLERLCCRENDSSDYSWKDGDLLHTDQSRSPNISILEEAPNSISIEMTEKNMRCTNNGEPSESIENLCENTDGINMEMQHQNDIPVDPISGYDLSK